MRLSVPMKHLFTLLTLAISFTGVGQQMPYNPDANGDDFVGVDDVLGVLGVYDTALMQPDLQCDYEGTDLEQLFGGIFAGSLILDSLYIEYLLIDSVLTYLPECPAPVTVETVLARSYMLQINGPYTTSSGLELNSNTDYLGYSRNLDITFNNLNGIFNLRLHDDEVYSLTSYTHYWAYTNSDTTGTGCTQGSSLPFPEYWTLNDDGMALTYCPNYWVSNAEIFRLIPFWHEAE